MIGVGLSTASQVQASKANAQAAKAESQQLQASQQMDMAATRQENRAVLSKQLAMSAASGVDTTSGSPLENALQSAYEGEMNALKIGYGYDIRRNAKRYEAGRYTAQIPYTIGSGVTRMGSSLLRSYAYPGATNDYGLGGNYDTSV